MTTAEPAAIGRAVRWLVLFCTAFGLAAMHTLGHAGVHVDAHETPAVMADVAAGMAAGAAQPGLGHDAVAAVSGHCPDDHCGGQPGHGGVNGWAVCLAVLGGLAVAVLLAALLLWPVTGLLARGRERLVGLRGPRPPPPRRLGLTVASAAVLRI